MEHHIQALELSKDTVLSSEILLVVQPSQELAETLQLDTLACSQSNRRRNTGVKGSQIV